MLVRPRSAVFVTAALLALLLAGCSEGTIEATLPPDQAASAAKPGSADGTSSLSAPVEACISALQRVDIHLLQWEAAVREQCLALSDADQSLAALTASLRMRHEITFLPAAQALQEMAADHFPYQVKPGSEHEERLARAGVYQAQRSFAQAQIDPVEQCRWYMVLTGIKHKTGDADADYADRRVVCNKLTGDQIYEARSKAREVIDAINADRLD